MLRRPHTPIPRCDMTMSGHGDSRTLVVSWHWPPVNRASAGVLGALFRTAPYGAFRVVTRSFSDSSSVDHRPAPHDLDRRVPATRIPAFPHTHRTSALTGLMEITRTFRAIVRAGCATGRTWNASRVLAVYPHRYSLLAGWCIARRLRIPLALYMHDLCAEAITFKNPLRRGFWRVVDLLCLKQADLVLVPTRQFADHYQRRGIPSTWVLPHCVNPSVKVPEFPQPRRKLHLHYSGLIYEPHEDAARAFLRATRTLPDVAVTFHSNPEGCRGLLGQAGAQWVPFDAATAALARADVLLMFLGTHTPCPLEVMGCFPSKMVEYLCAGRPILAVVPCGSFVDRFISDNKCGLVVTDHDPHTITRAIDRLRNPVIRRRMAAAVWISA